VRCTLKNHGLIYGYKHFAALSLELKGFTFWKGETFLAGQ
jgi:hypothetical protein